MSEPRDPEHALAACLAFLLILGCSTSPSREEGPPPPSPREAGNPGAAAAPAALEGDPVQGPKPWAHLAVALPGLLDSLGPSGGDPGPLPAEEFLKAFGNAAGDESRPGAPECAPIRAALADLLFGSCNPSDVAALTGFVRAGGRGSLLKVPAVFKRPFESRAECRRLTRFLIQVVEAAYPEMDASFIVQGLFGLSLEQEDRLDSALLGAWLCVRSPQRANRAFEAALPLLLRRSSRAGIDYMLLLRDVGPGIASVADEAIGEMDAETLNRFAMARESKLLWVVWMLGVRGGSRKCQDLAGELLSRTPWPDAWSSIQALTPVFFEQRDRIEILKILLDREPLKDPGGLSLFLRNFNHIARDRYARYSPVLHRFHDEILRKDTSDLDDMAKSYIPRVARRLDAIFVAHEGSDAFRKAAEQLDPRSFVEPLTSQTAEEASLLMSDDLPIDAMAFETRKLLEDRRGIDPLVLSSALFFLTLRGRFLMEGGEHFCWITEEFLPRWAAMSAVVERPLDAAACGEMLSLLRKIELSESARLFADAAAVAVGESTADSGQIKAPEAPAQLGSLQGMARVAAVVLDSGTGDAALLRQILEEYSGLPNKDRRYRGSFYRCSVEAQGVKGRKQVAEQIEALSASAETKVAFGDAFAWYGTAGAKAEWLIANWPAITDILARDELSGFDADTAAKLALRFPALREKLLAWMEERMTASVKHELIKQLILNKVAHFCQMFEAGPGTRARLLEFMTQNRDRIVRSAGDDPRKIDSIESAFGIAVQRIRSD